jgi:Protein of unknown function (DUF1570)
VVLLLTHLGAAPPPVLPVYQTRHYTLHTDVAPDLARDIAQRLDAMYDEYAKRLRAFGVGSSRTHDVWVFNRKIDYMKFIDDRLPNTGGVFIPSKNCLAVYLEGQGRDALRRTLQHEAFHQFAYDVFGSGLPVWINEGIAQLFEEGIYAGEDFFVEQIPPRRLRQLQDDMRNGRLTPFEQFVFMDHKTWAQNMRDRDKGSTQYNQAWAMVHFLVYATDARTGKTITRDRFFDMLTDIRNGVDAREAFVNHLTDDYETFQRVFVEYARSLKPTSEAVYMENAEVLGDMMVEILSQERRTFRSVGDFRTHLERGGYQLKYTKGQLRWSTNPDIGVYFKDAAGRELNASQVVFIPNPTAPLNDLLFRPEGRLEYRARFYVGPDGKPDREVIVRNK